MGAKQPRTLLVAGLRLGREVTTDQLVPTLEMSVALHPICRVISRLAEG